MNPDYDARARSELGEFVYYLSVLDVLFFEVYSMNERAV